MPDIARSTHRLFAIRTAAWLATLGLGLWFLRGALIDGLLLAAGIVTLSVGAAGALAYLIRRRTGGAEHAGTGLKPVWVFVCAAGILLSVTGLVALVRDLSR